LAHTSELLPPGTAVRLEYDVEHLDRYERTLAYVYRLDDGLFVNLDLLTEGYAEQFTVPPNVARAEELSRAVATARNAGKGLWSGVCGQVGDDG
jgi:micrococcal nuclease